MPHTLEASEHPIVGRLRSSASFSIVVRLSGWSVPCDRPIPMLSICDCQLTPDDAAVLIGRLDDDYTVLSDEAAAALRFAVAAGVPIAILDYDLRDAISHVLHEPLPAGLVALRNALDSGCC